MQTQKERRKRHSLRSMVNYLITNVYMSYVHPTLGSIKKEDGVNAMLARVRKS